MNPVADALEELISLGVEGPALVAAIRRIETAAYEHRLRSMEEAVDRAGAQADASRIKERDRKRTYREGKASVSQGQDGTSQGHRGTSGDVLDIPPALDKETSPTPPKEINPPPEGSIADAIVPSHLGDVPLEKAKAKLRAQADEIWAMQPVLGGKRRATRPDVAKAFAAAVSRGGAPADILACCRAYYALPASTKDGGQFAKGADSLLAVDRWEEYRPAENAPHAVPVAWAGPEDVRDAILAETNDDFFRAYLLPSEWHPPEAHELLGSIRPRTSYAFDKLARLKCLSSVAGLLQPAPRSRAA